MVSKNNGTFEPPLTMYIATFQNHIAQSRITDHNVLIGFFSAGIPSRLMKSIYSMEMVPTTIDNWHKKALTFQTHYKRAREVEQRRKNPTGTYHPFTTTPTTPARDPNAMEVDVIKVAKLSKEERERCMREGLYLRCRKKGHVAQNCPAFSQGKPASVRKVEEIQTPHESFDDEVTIGKVAVAISRDF